MAAAEEKTAVTIEQLRARIRKLEAAPREEGSVLTTGVQPFDGLFPGGGLPLGQTVELCGEAASGRTTLALRAIAAAQREGGLAAFVDGPGQLYAPAAVAQGVDLPRMLRVRLPEPERLLWTAVQLARSGAFRCVVLDPDGTGVHPRAPEIKRLKDAAFRGGTLVLWLSTPRRPGEGTVRIGLEATAEGLRAEVRRSRQGGLGAQTWIPWEMLWPVLRSSGAQVGPAPLLPPRPEELSTVGSGPHRSGWHGHGAPRPGRDMPLPALGQMLGERPGRRPVRTVVPVGDGPLR